MNLTFDIYVLLIGQGRRSHPKWSEFSMIDSKSWKGFNRNLNTFRDNDCCKGASDPLNKNAYVD